VSSVNYHDMYHLSNELITCTKLAILNGVTMLLYGNSSIDDDHLISGMLEWLHSTSHFSLLNIDKKRTYML